MFLQNTLTLQKRCSLVAVIFELLQLLIAIPAVPGKGVFQSVLNSSQCAKSQKVTGMMQWDEFCTCPEENCQFSSLIEDESCYLSACFFIQSDMFCLCSFFPGFYFSIFQPLLLHSFTVKLTVALCTVKICALKTSECFLMFQQVISAQNDLFTGPSSGDLAADFRALRMSLQRNLLSFPLGRLT